MVEVKKKNNESMESLIRRFNKKVQQSGVLNRVKDGQFFVAPRTRRQVKISAVRKQLISDKKEYLKKIGQIDEEELKRSRTPLGRKLKIKKVK